MYKSHYYGDKETKQLQESITKATSKDDNAPKVKHIRNCTVYTWKHLSSFFFWRSLMDHDMIEDVEYFKALILIHKIIREGHCICLKEADSKRAYISNLINQSNVDDIYGYGKLISSYVKCIVAKLDLYFKFKFITGNLELDEHIISKELPSKEEKVEFVSQLQLLLGLFCDHYALTLKSLKSLVNECKIYSLAPLIQECYSIFKLVKQVQNILKKNFYTDESKDRLSTMYNTQKTILIDLFRQAKTYELITSIIRIPDLENLSLEYIDEDVSSITNEDPTEFQPPKPIQTSSTTENQEHKLKETYSSIKIDYSNSGSLIDLDDMPRPHQDKHTRVGSDNIYAPNNFGYRDNYQTYNNTCPYNDDYQGSSRSDYPLAANNQQSLYHNELSNSYNKQGLTSKDAYSPVVQNQPSISHNQAIPSNLRLTGNNGYSTSIQNNQLNANNNPLFSYNVQRPPARAVYNSVNQKSDYQNNKVSSYTNFHTLPIKDIAIHHSSQNDQRFSNNYQKISQNDEITNKITEKMRSLLKNIAQKECKNLQAQLKFYQSQLESPNYMGNLEPKQSEIIHQLDKLDKLNFDLVSYIKEIYKTKNYDELEVAYMGLFDTINRYWHVVMHLGNDIKGYSGLQTNNKLAELFKTHLAHVSSLSQIVSGDKLLGQSLEMELFNQGYRLCEESLNKLLLEVKNPKQAQSIQQTASNSSYMHENSNQNVQPWRPNHQAIYNNGYINSPIAQTVPQHQVAGNSVASMKTNLRTELGDIISTMEDVLNAANKNIKTKFSGPIYQLTMGLIMIVRFTDKSHLPITNEIVGLANRILALVKNIHMANDDEQRLQQECSDVGFIFKFVELVSYILLDHMVEDFATCVKNVSNAINVLHSFVVKMEPSNMRSNFSNRGRDARQSNDFDFFN